MSNTLPNSFFSSSPRLEAVVTRSLERSRRYGLDPHLDGAPESSRLTAQELQNRISNQHVFFTLAKAQLDALYRLLKESGLCLILADADGYVLYATGDAALVEHCKRRRCLPGYRWTERDVGTCAMGLALEEREPVVLSGKHVFAIAEQKLCHAAAPVFSPDGNQLLGVMALSCKADVAHPHTSGLVQQAAEAVSAQLLNGRRLQELEAQNQHLRTVAEADSAGRVSVDMDGRIVEITRTAQKILDIQPPCAGRLLTDSLHLPELTTLLRGGKGFSMQEFFVPQTGGTQYISLDPIRLRNGIPAGGVVCIHEKQALRRLAVEMAGIRAFGTFEAIRGDSEALRATRHLARQAADGTSPVLLCGEDGSGKTLFAQAIHHANQRRTGPFVSVHCKRLSGERLECELFGCEEGVLGAPRGGWPGKFELAEGGTLFLQDVDAIPQTVQTRLLRVLQTGRVQRVGGMRAASVDVRLVSATCLDLLAAVARRAFLAELFYSLSILYISVPSLRDHAEDIVPLAEHFLQAYTLTRPDLELSPEALQTLQRHPWPGNVRQLQHVVSQAAYLAQNGPLLPAHLALDDSAPPPRLACATGATLDEVERYAVAAALTRFQGNISRAAAALGVSRPTLYRKMLKYKIA